MKMDKQNVQISFKLSAEASATIKDYCKRESLILSRFLTNSALKEIERRESEDKRYNRTGKQR